MRYLSEQTMLPKDNMVGDVKAMSNRIITSISFLSFTITKEATKTRTRLEFVVFMRLKKDEIGRAKGSEMLIVRWRWGSNRDTSSRKTKTGNLKQTPNFMASPKFLPCPGILHNTTKVIKNNAIAKFS